MIGPTFNLTSALAASAPLVRLQGNHQLRVACHWLRCAALSPPLSLPQSIAHTLALTLSLPPLQLLSNCVRSKVKIKCKCASAKCAQMFFWANTANKTEQRKQIQRKRKWKKIGKRRGGKAEEEKQHSMFCRDWRLASLSISFSLQKFPSLCCQFFMALFSPKCGTMGNISLRHTQEIDYYL